MMFKFSIIFISIVLRMLLFLCFELKGLTLRGVYTSPHPGVKFCNALHFQKAANIDFIVETTASFWLLI